MLYTQLSCHYKDITYNQKKTAHSKWLMIRWLCRGVRL